ncbi:Uu.00g087570.m01.CDS01 [Anthostomella pinea]|uniref:Uu.00g087570.m01.CDS01 n=1 Tax=Anthostomella pinea TaxID=933095 RepID=A0AAI8VNA7_9PEZI|nr:Uu.00g087570.m01.CDS01 [Anthostomella pinea]
MPIGWYLAQGLHPLGPSSSDDEEGPCELPNGKIVCGSHGLVTCGRCCTSYDFGDNDEFEEDKEDGVEGDDELFPNTLARLLRERGVIPNQLDETDSEAPHMPDRFGPEMRRGTGRVFPTVFTPPSVHITPAELFHGKATYARLTR